MAVRLYREYRLKFYLNAKHYIIINGHKGETHPHTWEFTLSIRYGRGRPMTRRSLRSWKS